MNEFEIYKNFFPKQSIVYDIGAHIGEMSKHFIQNGAELVYAFEPSQKNFFDLVKNVQGLQVECYNIGFHNQKYSCMTKFKDCRTDQDLDKEQYIEYYVIEDFMLKNNLARPDFIKIDIEGMESIVLKTFDLIFNKIRPIIYVEIHAAKRGNAIQNYKNNPHWIWPEDGGFDFNDLKKFKYKIINNNIELPYNSDYNPLEGSHTGYILLPF